MRISVKGVNYSGDVMVFSVDDPAAPKNSTGGDRAGPYTGAGIQCCVELPKVWHPGIQLVIDAIIYPVDETDFKRDLPRYMKKFPVEVPQYPADQPTELWVIRSKEGDMKLIASNVDPSHGAWPGDSKGWPDPSIAYKRRQWETRVAETKDSIERTKEFLLEGMANPVARKKAWDVRKENRPKVIAQFSGPDDPAFAEWITKERKETLVYLEKKLKELIEYKP